MSQEIIPLGQSDDRRTFTVPQRRVLYWRWATGGESRREAAEIADVSENTIYVWLRREDFRAAWDEPESWAKREIRTQRNTLELKALHTAHALLDDPHTPATVQADVLAKSLTDVRRTKQLQLEAAQTQVWAELIDQWSRDSAEMLANAVPGDGSQTGVNATIAGVEDEGQTDERVSDGDGK